MVNQVVLTRTGFRAITQQAPPQDGGNLDGGHAATSYGPGDHVDCGNARRAFFTVYYDGGYT